MSDLVRATVLELRKSAGTPARRGLLIASGVVGLLSAALVTVLGSAQDHTFSVISFSTQSAISLPLPFVSVLLMTQDFWRRIPTTRASGMSRDAIIVAKLLASMIIAVAGATYGVLISVLGTRAAAPAAEEGRWDGIGVIILGSVLVQLIAQLSGAGWGLLLGSSAVAITVDVAAPLGLWIVTGAVPGLQGISGVACTLPVRTEPAVWLHGRSALGSGGRHCACVGHRAQRRWDTPCTSPSPNRRTLNSSSIG